MALSLGGLLLAWAVYDLLLRFVPDEDVVAGAIVGLPRSRPGAQASSSRRARRGCRSGAMLGTIMAANVFFSIIPAHRGLIAAKEEGLEPDPRPGLDAQAPLGAQQLPDAAGAGDDARRARAVPLRALACLADPARADGDRRRFRLFFNLRHTGRTRFSILLLGAAALLALAIGLRPDDSTGGSATTKPVAFAAVRRIVDERCITCHSGVSAPAGIRLDDDAVLVARAALVRTVVSTGAMPLGNRTGMTDAERRTVVAWVDQGAAK